MTVHIEHLVQAKEWTNVVLQSIVSYILGNAVRTMLEWSKLLMGSCKAFFLQMQPNIVAHLKLVWYPCRRGEVVPVFFHDRIPLLLLLRGGTLHGDRGFSNHLPLTLGANQTENKFPSL